MCLTCCCSCVLDKFPNTVSFKRASSCCCSCQDVIRKLLVGVSAGIIADLCCWLKLDVSWLYRTTNVFSSCRLNGTVAAETCLARFMARLLVHMLLLLLVVLLLLMLFLMLTVVVSINVQKRLLCGCGVLLMDWCLADTVQLAAWQDARASAR